MLDTESREIIEKIEFEVPGIRKEAIQPVGVNINGKGDKVFIALGPVARIAVVNTTTFEVERLLVSQRVWNLACSPDESRIFTTNGVSSDVSVIDAESLKVLKSVKVGRLPWGVITRP